MRTRAIWLARAYFGGRGTSQHVRLGNEDDSEGAQVIKQKLDVTLREELWLCKQLWLPVVCS